MTAISPIQFGQNLPLTPTGVVPISKGELRVINTNPHSQREKGLIPIPILKERQFGSILTLSKASSGQLLQAGSSEARPSSSNVVSISTRETEKDITSLTSSGNEESALVADTGISPASKTQYGKQYLMHYDERVANSP